MTIELPAFYGTFLASTGIKQYSFVDITSTGTSPNKIAKLILPATGQLKRKAIGVLVSSGTTNSTVRKPQTVQFLGVAKVRSGSTAFAAGDLVMPSSLGRALRAASTSSTAGVVGYCVSPSQSTKSDGTEFINLVLTYPGRQR